MGKFRVMTFVFSGSSQKNNEDSVMLTIHAHYVHMLSSGVAQDAVFEHTFMGASFDCMIQTWLTCKRLLRWPTVSLAVITHASLEHLDLAFQLQKPHQTEI